MNTCSFSDAVELVTPIAVPRVIAADADDDQVITAAIPTEADFLVSGDRHRLAVGSYNNIRMVAPIEAIRMIRVT